MMRGEAARRRGAAGRVTPREAEGTEGGGGVPSHAGAPSTRPVEEGQTRPRPPDNLPSAVRWGVVAAAKPDWGGAGVWGWREGGGGRHRARSLQLAAVALSTGRGSCFIGDPACSGVPDRGTEHAWEPVQPPLGTTNLPRRRGSGLSVDPSPQA
jgi:hypothetical protein